MLQRADVVLRQIEEQAGGKRHPIDTLLLVRLRGNLHGKVPDAVGEGIGKALLQLQRFRGGEMRFGALAAGIHFHGGKNSGAPSQRDIQNAFDEVRGGGFALGAGQADEGELLGGAAVVFRRQHRKRPAGIADQQGGGGRRITLLRQIAGGALLQRALQVFGAEVQPLADEKRAGSDVPAIVGNGGEDQLLRAAGRLQQQAVGLQRRPGAGKGEGVFHSG